MTHFAVSHDFVGDAEAYWKIFFDETFKRELYARIVVKERTVVSRKEDETTIRYSERILPSRDLPGFMKKILGGDLGYTENCVYHKGKNRIDISIDPSMLKDRTKISGVYTLVTAAPGKLRRTFEGDLKVDVALVGGKIERTIIDDITRSYGIAAQVLQQWLDRSGQRHD